MIQLKGTKKTAIFILSLILVINIVIALMSMLPSVELSVDLQDQTDTSTMLDAESELACDPLDFSAADALEKEGLANIAPSASQDTTQDPSQNSKFGLIHIILIIALVFLIIKFSQARGKKFKTYIYAGAILLTISALAGLFITEYFNVQDKHTSAGLARSTDSTTKTTTDTTIQSTEQSLAQTQNDQLNAAYLDAIKNSDCKPIIRPTSGKGFSESGADLFLKYTWLINFLLLGVIGFVLAVYFRKKNAEPIVYEEIEPEIIEPQEIAIKEITIESYEAGVYDIYRQLCEIAKIKNGLTRRKSMTSTEYGELLVKLDFPQEDVFEIINAFEALRYGKIQVATQHVERLNRALSNINIAMKLTNKKDQT